MNVSNTEYAQMARRCASRTDPPKVFKADAWNYSCFTRPFVQPPAPVFVTPEQHADLRARRAAHDAVIDRKYPPKTKGGGRSWPADDPEIPPFTNDERALIEVFEFARDRPDRYTFYVGAGTPGDPRLDLGVITNWMGLKFAHIYEAEGTLRYGRILDGGAGYRRCRRICALAFTGDKYQGTTDLDAGCYINMKKIRTK